MSDVCLNIDMIIKYMHQKLNHQEKLLFFNHIINCPKCLEELKFMLSLNKALNKNIKNVPQKVAKNAFNKVKEVNEIKKINSITSDLVNIFITNIPTPNVSFKVLTNLLSNIRNIVNLSVNKI